MTNNRLRIEGSIADAVRGVIALDSKVAAAKLGMGLFSYIQARDIVLLTERGDLDAASAAVVRQALELLEQKRQVSRAHQLVKPIVRAVWGNGLRVPGKRSRPTDVIRRQRFNKAMTIITQICDNAVLIEPPHLTEQDRERACSQISEARRSLNALYHRLRRKGDANGSA